MKKMTVKLLKRYYKTMKGCTYLDEKWEEDFEEAYNFCLVSDGFYGVHLMGRDLYLLLSKYIGHAKLKFQCRKGEVRITKKEK